MLDKYEEINLKMTKRHMRKNEHELFDKKLYRSDSSETFSTGRRTDDSRFKVKTTS
jgi:hypothetical protein